MMYSCFALLLAALINPVVGSAQDTASAHQAQTALREAGIEDAVAGAIIDCVVAAEDRGLPTEALLSRLREGLVKRAPPDALLAAMRQRLAALESARDLLGEEICNRRHAGPAVSACLDIFTRAIESGLSRDTLSVLLEGAPGLSMNRLQAAVEAGEMLHLAGVGPEAIAFFMEDVRRRDLRRMETLRAAQTWIRLHREGLDGHAIRERAWPPDRPPRQNGGGNGHGGARLRLRRGVAP